MNDKTEIDDIEVLIQAAGKRPMPSAEMAAAIKAQTQQDWQHAVQQHKTKWRAGWASAAVAASVAVLAVVMWPNTATDTGATMTVLASEGNCANQTIKRDAAFNTGASCNVVLGLDQLRLYVDGSTQLTWQGSNHVYLHSGRVYVDGADETASIRIETDWGIMTDIGTLFEVEAQPSGLTLTLREGAVALNTGDQQWLASAKSGNGDQLIVKQDRSVEKNTVATEGSRWAWAQKLQPAFDLEGKTVADCANWAARIEGLEVVYATEQARKTAMTSPLQGRAIAAQDIRTSLPLVVKAAGLQLRFDGHRLVIE